MATILVIDDEPPIVRGLRFYFESRSHSVTSASSGRSGVEKFLAARPDIVVCDIALPDQTGLEVFWQIRQIDPGVPVIFITGQSSTDLAIATAAAGGVGFIQKPFEMAAIAAAVDRALATAQLSRDSAVVFPTDAELRTGPVLVGRSPGMQEVYRAIGRVARQRVTVLVLGESGTGKELVARAIHAHSGRGGRPFVALNCAAIPEPLLEAELFGHERGAFTGADRLRVGKFEQANGGTLFLDEVGEMSLALQAKLLRVLQDQTFQRVGGAEELCTDVRVVAATNRDLAQAITASQFRADLYYRLAGYTIALPPLRDRKEDLEPLVQFFLGQLSAELGVSVRGISGPALQKLRDHSWPGNLRELQAVLRRGLLDATGSVLTPDLLQLPPPMGTPEPAPAPTAADMDAFIEARIKAGTTDLYAEWLARSEPALLQAVLSRFDGNLTRAAETLGLNRTTLRTRIRQFGVKSSEGPSD